MPYKEKLTIDDLNSSVLPVLKDFIGQVLDLSEIYHSEIVIQVANPPKKDDESAFRFNLFQNNDIEGKYQDDALLKESAENTINKIVTLKKFEGIRDVRIDTEMPLEKREVKFGVNSPILVRLYEEIETRMEKERKIEEERKRKKEEMYYQDCKVCLDDKCFDVSGFEDAIAKTVFSNTDNEEINAGDVIEEYTGQIFSKTTHEKYLESVRQAIYRLKDKISDEFKIKDYLKYSTKTRVITENKKTK